MTLGRWGKLIPKDPAGNRQYRAALLRKCEKDPVMQAACIQAAKEDLIWWVNSWVIQFNPNAIQGGVFEEVGPFTTEDFQDDVIDTVLSCVRDRKDLVIEKSREMGISWLLLLVATHAYLFHSWKKYLVISRNADAVDKAGDPDSLFWKIDFVLTHLPDWMTKGRVARKGMVFENPLTNSTIVGQASTGKAGVGGRATAMIIDEFSQIREDYEVLSRTSDTTGCRIFCGTHKGVGTAFYELTRRADIRKVVLHWTQHPDKRRGLYKKREGANDVEILDGTYHHHPEYRWVLDGRPAGGPFPGLRSPWYDEQCRRKGSARDVAMDLDIDPSGSKEQFFDALRVEDLIRQYARPPFWVGDLHYDRESGEPFELVRNPSGRLRLWLWPDSDKRPPVGRYGIGGDISNGVGATPSTAAIFDHTGQKVGEYADAFIEPSAYAVFLVALARFFKAEDGDGARLGWERNGPGAATTKRVLELRYLNVYWNVQPLQFGAKETKNPGWYNTNESSRVLMDDYRAALYAGRCINRSETALKECLEYAYTHEGVKHTGSLSGKEVSGARENHGDQVIADALGWMMVKERVRPKAGREESQEVRVGSLAWRRQLAREQEMLEEQWA